MKTKSANVKAIDKTAADEAYLIDLRKMLIEELAKFADTSDLPAFCDLSWQSDGDRYSVMVASDGGRWRLIGGLNASEAGRCFFFCNYELEDLPEGLSVSVVTDASLFEALEFVDLACERTSKPPKTRRGVKAYVLEVKKDGQERVWPEALPLRTAQSAAKKLREDGFEAIVRQIELDFAVMLKSARRQS